MDVLYLNNLEMDLEANSVTRTLQSNDFTEIKFRQSNFSNNIKLPNTARNVQNLDFLGVKGSASRTPYTKLSVKYVSDGIELISDGSGVIRKSKTDGFDLVIYDGNIGLSELLGSDPLSDIVLPSEESRTMSFNDFFQQISNTGNGLISAVDETALNYLESTSFFFYLHTAFKRIFTDKGYTINSDFINADPDFENRVFSMGKGWSHESFVENIFPITTLNGTLTCAGSNPPDPIGKEFTLITYTAPSDTEKVKVEVLVEVEENWFGKDFGVRAKKIPVTGSTETIADLVSFDVPIQEGNQGGNSAANRVSFNFYVDLLAGDQVQIYWVCSGKDLNPYNFTFKTASTVVFSVDNSSWSIPSTSDLFPDITQIDFVKEVMTRFNLMFSIDSKEKIVTFQTSEEMLSDFTTAEDWSSKFIKLVDEEFTSRYAQENTLEYQQDNDGSKEGNGIMYVQNVNLTPERTILTSIFKSSPSVSETSTEFGVKLWSVPEDPSKEVKPATDTIRLFRVTRDATTVLPISVGVSRSSYKNTGDQRFGLTRTQSVNKISFEEVSYQNEISKYYSRFNEMLDNYNKVKIEADLSLIDIYSLDFFKLKYFQDLGRYYYLNKVLNFKKNKPTTIELIEVPL